VRYGGEEFALALPGCDLDDAIATVERLREVTPSGQTWSAGISCWDGEEVAEELLDRADRALYEAKRSGRDRTVLAQPSADLNRESSSSSIE
jgi:diguanylate cyclase (GGDEF)-like protein